MFGGQWSLEMKLTGLEMKATMGAELTTAAEGELVVQDEGQQSQKTMEMATAQSVFVWLILTKK